MAQSLMTLILTGLLLLGQSLGIHTPAQPKTLDDLMSAFNDLRTSFLEATEPLEAPEPLEEARSGAHSPPDGESETQTETTMGSETVETHLIGQGQEWETEYWVVDSGVDGPTVMVIGGIHGDEPAVALAGDRLVEAVGDVARGRVILLPKANVPAIRAKKRLVGTDLNRAFPRSEGDEVESPLAGAIWQLVQEYHPDWLIDLHDETSDVTGQTVTHHPAQEEAAWAAQAMAEALSGTADDAAFTPAGGLADGSLAKAAAEILDVRVLALETHRRFSLAQRADWLVSGTTYLLTHLGMR